MLRIAAAFALCLAAPAIASAEEEAAPFPTWLAGAWGSAEEDHWTEEFWTHPRAGMMIGASRGGRGETLRSWETIRIVRTEDGSLAYVPMPNGGSSVEFTLANQSDQSIEFANPAHDYPQRIRYWREGGRLHAEISLLDGSRAMRWSYAPIGG